MTLGCQGRLHFLLSSVGNLPGEQAVHNQLCHMSAYPAPNHLCLPMVPGVYPNLRPGEVGSGPEGETWAGQRQQGHVQMVALKKSKLWVIWIQHALKGPCGDCTQVV